MPIQVAVGTSLGALLLPAGLLGALVYYRAGNLSVRAALIIAGGLFLAPTSARRSRMSSRARR